MDASQAPPSAVAQSVVDNPFDPESTSTSITGKRARGVSFILEPALPGPAGRTAPPDTDGDGDGDDNISGGAMGSNSNSNSSVSEELSTPTRTARRRAPYAPDRSTLLNSDDRASLGSAHKQCNCEDSTHCSCPAWKHAAAGLEQSGTAGASASDGTAFQSPPTGAAPAAKRLKSALRTTSAYPDLPPDAPLSFDVPWQRPTILQKHHRRPPHSGSLFSAAAAASARLKQHRFIVPARGMKTGLGSNSGRSLPMLLPMPSLIPPGRGLMEAAVTLAARLSAKLVSSPSPQPTAAPTRAGGSAALARPPSGRGTIAEGGDGASAVLPFVSPGPAAASAASAATVAIDSMTSADSATSIGSEPLTSPPSSAMKKRVTFGPARVVTRDAGDTRSASAAYYRRSVADQMSHSVPSITADTLAPAPAVVGDVDDAEDSDTAAPLPGPSRIALLSPVSVSDVESEAESKCGSSEDDGQHMPVAASASAPAAPAAAADGDAGTDAALPTMNSATSPPVAPFSTSFTAPNDSVTGRRRGGDVALLARNGEWMCGGTRLQREGRGREGRRGSGALVAVPCGAVWADSKTGCFHCGAWRPGYGPQA